MPRILVVARAYPPTIGGMERFAFKLTTELAQTTRVLAITNTKGKPFLPVFLPAAAAGAILFSKFSQVDLIHLCDALLAPIGALVKRFSRIPVTVSTDGLDVSYANPLYQRILRRSLPNLDSIIANSSYTRDLVLSRVPEVSGRTTVIPCGVDAPNPGVRYIPLPSMLAGRMYEKKVILTVGRLIKRKGIAWFISNVLPRLEEDVLYVVVGEGPEEQPIRHAAAKAGVESRVLLLGKVEEYVKEALYGQADLFIMPNIKQRDDVEGFGLVALEAASNGLPVIAANLDGISDAVRANENGFMVEAENADSFISMISFLLNMQREERRLIGERFQDYTMRHYSWTRTAQCYLEEFERLNSSRLTYYESQGSEVGTHADPHGRLQPHN